ncbi:MAG: cytochrome C biogenesis protein, partial [Bdellovibrionales bacterium]
MIRLLVLALSVASVCASASVGKPLESLPVQDGGRVKPYDTFARESLQLIYGKSTYEGRPATEVVFTWLLIPDHWLNTPLIEVRHAGLKEALKLPLEKRHFTPQSLFMNERIPLLHQELQNLLSRQEKLNPYYQAVQRLQNQLGLFHAIRTGTALRVVPDPSS